MTFLLGVPSADAVDFIPPRFLDLDPGRSTQIQGDPCRSEYMAVERPCVPVYVWKEAASTVEHRCWLPFVWMHPVWGMWRITNSAQQNEAARSPACAPAYLEHALERGHTWPPLGVTRGRGKHPGCESQAMGPHHPKSDPLFAQHPVVRILGDCLEDIIEPIGGDAPEPDSGVEELSHLRATRPSSHPRGQIYLFDFYTDFTKFQA